MAKNVFDAFNEFMRDKIDLDPDVVSDARKSRDNLIENINDFDNKNFFRFYHEINIQFGSFARKTKKRPLDDIDLMIGIAADGATYNASDPWNDVRINASKENATQQDCLNDDGVTLNSTKVLNRFKSKLEGLRDYNKSEIHRNGEAVTLNLVSRDWAFDIVPCFQTVYETNGRNYYLIPNGNGGWQKTDPRKDRDYVAKVNDEKKKMVLPLVRLCKKWFEVKKFETPASYLMETLIVRYCESKKVLDDVIFWRFMEFLDYLENGIYNPVQDMKDIQGNINDLNLLDRCKISERAKFDSQKVLDALNAEFKEKNRPKAVNLWREIFGEDFPTYG